MVAVIIALVYGIGIGAMLTNAYMCYTYNEEGIRTVMEWKDFFLLPVVTLAWPILLILILIIEAITPKGE